MKTPELPDEKDPAIKKRAYNEEVLRVHNITEDKLAQFLMEIPLDPDDSAKVERAMKSTKVQKIAKDMREMFGGAMEASFDLAA